jgi:tetratricopeptide (TPR) repeat protein
MKFVLSIPSLLGHVSSILLLGFSIPLVFAQILDSNMSSDCEFTIPKHFHSADDFVSMGHFQEDCQQDIEAAISDFTQGIRLNHKAEEPYYHRANAYYNFGNYKAAVEDYTEVIRQNTGRRGYSSEAY